MQTQLSDPAADTLPLAFLASVAHPDASLRERVAGRLDDYIAARQPLHTSEQVCEFLARQAGTPLEPFSLEPAALAVRLVRLAFVKQTARFAQVRVRLGSSAALDNHGGLLIAPSLKSRYLERFSLGVRHREPEDAFHLVTSAIEPRLKQLAAANARFRVTCRSVAGFRLAVRGRLPWKLTEQPASLRGLQQGSTLGSKTLESAGLRLECKGNVLSVCTTTPESIIQFSACLARGERLILRQRHQTLGAGRIVIALRDFEGARAVLPAVAGYSGRETRWLRVPRLPPGPPLALGTQDKAAIARWLYAPDCWLGPEDSLTDQLLAGPA
jgi:hypothetical protein